MQTTCIIVVTLVALANFTSAQISFSTNWGSGKRSGYQDLQSTACLDDLEINVMKDLAALIKMEANRAAKCIIDTKTRKLTGVYETPDK